MKKFIAVAALIAAPLAAQAADLPSKKAPAMAPVVAAAPVFTWTGCHVGVNVGFASQNSSYYDNSEDIGMGSHTGNGAIGGGQIGCDYQINNFVVGVQGSFDAGSVKGTGSNDDTYYEVAETVETKMNWMATATARAGYLLEPQFLLYVTGGAAWVNNTLTDSSSTYYGSEKTTHTGWLIGGGAEYALDKNWSLFTEYNYIKFSGKTFDVTYSGEDDGVSSITAKHDINRVVVGVNYKF